MCTTSVDTLPDPKKVISGTQMPEWVSAAGRQLYEQASEMAASPFPSFTGQRVATYGDALDTEGQPIQIGTDAEGNPLFRQERLTERERQGADLLSEGTDVTQPFIDRATDIAGTLGEGYNPATRQDLLGDQFTAETVQPFMDVYQRSVDPAVAEIERQTERNLRQSQADAARSGAFGGSRAGLREAELMSEGARLAGDLRAQAGARGLEFASQRFDQERAARLAAENAARSAYETEEAGRLRAAEVQTNLAPLVQGINEQAASGLITAGQAQRQLDQMALDLAYGDYVEQREYPFQMANFALGALKGVPYETRTIGLEQGQQFVQSPSVYGQTLGGLGSLASAYYLYGR